MDLPNIKGLILDMDGVLWRERAPVIDMPATFAAIRHRNLKIVLATNNSTKSPVAYQSLIRSFGVELEEWQILTSSLAVADLLHRRFPTGGPVYIIGESGLEEALLERGFFLSIQNPVAVVAGIDRQISFEKLKIATLFNPLRVAILWNESGPNFSHPGRSDSGCRLHPGRPGDSN